MQLPPLVPPPLARVSSALLLALMLHALLFEMRAFDEVAASLEGDGVVTVARALVSGWRPTGMSRRERKLC